MLGGLLVLCFLYIHYRAGRLMFFHRRTRRLGFSLLYFHCHTGQLMFFHRHARWPMAFSFLLLLLPSQSFFDRHVRWDVAFLVSLFADYRAGRLIFTSMFGDFLSQPCSAVFFSFSFTALLGGRLGFSFLFLLHQ